jgi:hypothetical protein
MGARGVETISAIAVFHNQPLRLRAMSVEAITLSPASTSFEDAILRPAIRK